MDWVNDQKVEKSLIDLGVKFDLRMFKIEDLQVDKSIKNNARLQQSLDDEMVERYAVAMTSKDKFPAIVCTPSGVILDGNHRVNAAIMCDRTEVLAYVVLNADKDMVQVIIRTFNTTHGKAINNDERIQHAIYLHMHNGMTLAEASKHVGIKFDDLKRAMEVREIRGKIEDAGLDSSNLHKTVVLLMSPIADNRTLLKRVAQLAINEKLVAREVNDIVERISRVDGDKKLEVVSEWRANIDSRRDKSHPFPIRSRLLKIIESDLPSLLKGVSSLDEIGIKTDHDVKSLKRRWRSIVSDLNKLIATASDVVKSKPK